MAAEFGLSNLGFLTLTFVHNITSFQEAQRRFNSLNSHVLGKRYKRAIGVWERQARGAWHIHLLAVAGHDIRTGCDFEAFKRQDYRSAPANLRAEWAFWRKTARRYGFGRTELLPVKSTIEAIGKYVGGYVAKHIGKRREEDKGIRTVRFLGYRAGDRKSSSRFAWNNANGKLWRQKLAAFAASIGAEDTDNLKKLFGSRWCYHLQGAIVNTPVPSDLPEPSPRP